MFDLKVFMMGIVAQKLMMKYQ